MPDFRERSMEPEIMDDLTCSGEIVNQTLREIDTINRLLGGNSVTVSGVQELLGKSKNRTITIADVGCGGGEILKLVAQWGRKKRVALSLTGIDANPAITDFARINGVDFPELQFKALDVFSEEFKKRKYDIITGTLFFHHFTSEQLTQLFRQLKSQAHLGVVINDIHRHPFAYYSIKLLTSVFSRSSMVKFDAPLSVLRAFTKRELQTILADAGIKKYTLRWRWAFRWQVIIPS